MPVKIICAWCGKLMREEGEEAGWRIGQDNEESHGICPECVDKHFGPGITEKIKAETFEIEMAEERKIKEG